MIKAILFDLGDTILHSDWKKRDGAMKKEAGISVLLTPETRVLYLEISAGKKPIEDLFKILIKNSNSKLNIEKVIEIYKKNYKKYSKVDKKMIALIRKLRKEYKVYAFSNTNKLHEEVNKKRGLYRYFDGVFLSCEMGYVKPAKEIFFKVLKKTGLDANEVIFVDDNESNISVAKEIGMEGIQFTVYGSLAKELKIRQVI